MAKHRILDIALRILCLVIAAYNFASLLGVSVSPWIDRVGMLLLLVFALSFALFGPKLIEPFKGIEK